MKIKAPWTDEQVNALNRWQNYGFVHEFTCPRGHTATDRRLLATSSGWRCESCDYTQDWAHDFMFEEQTNPLQGVKVVHVASVEEVFDVLRNMPPKKTP